ncbi:MAG: serpin family protein [Gemmatimonadetes bacterium]|nr:serpin family protein [Gemmatimonadota bacterium]
MVRPVTGGVRPPRVPVSVVRASLAATAGLILLAACGGDALAPVVDPPVRGDSLAALPRALTVVEQQGVQASNAFALQLLRGTVGAQPGKNVLLSPLSVSMLLGLTANGAAGETESQLQQVLGWGSRSRAEVNAAYQSLRALLPALDSTVTVRIANGVWVRQPLVADTGFAGAAQRHFAAPVLPGTTPAAMFAAVNDWGRQQTDGLVPQVLDQPPPDDLMMLLANAVLFAGRWRDAFDPAKTATGAFTLGTGTAVQVPLMTRSGRFQAAARSGTTAIELPYGNSAYSLLVVLPEGRTVDALVAGLDTTQVAALVQALGPVPETAPLTLPRFTVRANVELRPVLEGLGMPRAFSDRAEFPRLFTPAQGARLQFVKHAVTLEVTERGTRAAAVTAGGIGPTSMPMAYRVDRPFVFFIRERFANTILFAGVVRDPRS